MRKIIKPYRARLRFKHHFWFVPASVISIGVAVGFPHRPEVFLFTVGVLMSTSLCIHFLRMPPYYRNLLGFIEANDLYVARKRYLNDGLLQETVYRSIEIAVHIQDNDTFKFIIYKKGVRIDDDLEEFRSQLETITDCRVIDINSTRNYVAFTFKKSEKIRIDFQPMIVNNSHANGIFYYNIPIDSDRVWDFVHTPHGLVVGQTGSGKTFFLKYLLLMFIILGAYAICFDPKQVDFAPLKKTVHAVATEKKEFFEYIKNAVYIMEHRSQEMALQDVYHFQDYAPSMYPIVILIDEFSALMASMTTQEKRDFEMYFRQLILKGRACGIFVLCGLQRPDAQILSGDIRDQFGLKVGLGSMSDDGYRMIFDSIDDLETTGSQSGYYIINGNEMTVPEKFETPLMTNMTDFAELVRYCTDPKLYIDCSVGYKDPIVTKMIKEHFAKL